MIKRIIIKDVASYDHEGCTFDNLAKVNIIYGGNGTGKTTLSRMLAEEAKKEKKTENSLYKDCKVEWDGKPLEVLVYNQDFKQRNLKEKMPGVFTIGEIIKDIATKQGLQVKKINKKIKELEKQGTEEAKREIERLENEKSKIYDDLISSKPSIDSINKMLRLMGFTGFSIQPSTKDALGYQIQRADGSLAEDTLSEGEVTLITFLYFMQLVYCGGSNSENIAGRVVVIDDPVSSLDADVMFIVSEMVYQILDAARGRKTPRWRLPEWTISFDMGMPGFGLTWPVKGIVQVLVLTHNVYFYKQVTERQRRADTHHWKLLKRLGISQVREYGEENPIRSEYELLWSDIRKFYKDGESSASIRNVMRRIIETYFVVMGGYNKRKLIPENFSDDPEEMTIVNSLAKWADEGSHGFADDLYGGNSQEMNEKYMEVFHRLFVRLGHEAHYKMMMRDEKPQ